MYCDRAMLLANSIKCTCICTLFFISHCLSMVGLQPSSSLSTGCVVSLRGDWAIFCHAGSGRVGRVLSAREKSLEILRRGWELNPGHGEDRQGAIPLSYHGWICTLYSVVIWNYTCTCVTVRKCDFIPPPHRSGYDRISQQGKSSRLMTANSWNEMTFGSCLSQL